MVFHTAYFISPDIAHMCTGMVAVGREGGCGSVQTIPTCASDIVSKVGSLMVCSGLLLDIKHSGMNPSFLPPDMGKNNKLGSCLGWPAA